MSGASVDTPAAIFDAALRATEPPLGLKPGLKAIKKGEGHGKIAAEDAKQLLGSAAIDDDCRVCDPHGNRWDYVIGYERNSKAFAYFIEVHSAETSEVSKVEKKLRWLQDFLLKSPQEKLAALEREYYWVASGRINIPQHTQQFKHLHSTLRKAGLRGPVKHLTLT
jgi:hypothetical protein